MYLQYDGASKSGVPHNLTIQLEELPLVCTPRYLAALELGKEMSVHNISYIPHCWHRAFSPFPPSFSAKDCEVIMDLV
jgi:hypothetical protein